MTCKETLIAMVESMTPEEVKTMIHKSFSELGSFPDHCDRDLILSLQNHIITSVPDIMDRMRQS